MLSEDQPQMCIIFLAAHDELGWADEHPTLSELRAYRDQYVRRRAEGRDLIAAYYAYSARHACRAMADAAFRRDVVAELIDRPLALIRAGRLDEAFELVRAWLGREPLAACA